MVNKVCTTAITLLTLLLMMLSMYNVRDALYLDTECEAVVVDIYKYKDKEYCVYEYVTDDGIVIAKDKIHNKHGHFVNDQVIIYYNSSDIEDVTEYKSNIISTFGWVIVVEVSFLFILIMDLVRKGI